MMSKLVSKCNPQSKLAQKQALCYTCGITSDSQQLTKNLAMFSEDIFRTSTEQGLKGIEEKIK